MKQNRRNFLKVSGLTGIGIAGAGMAGSYAMRPTTQVINTQSQKVQHEWLCGAKT